MNTMGENLTHAITPHDMFTLKLFGLEIGVTDTVIAMWIIMAVLILGSFFLSRKLTLVPGKRQNVAEIVVEFINNLARNAVGHHWKPFAPYIGTVIIFLVFANTVSIFNVIPGHSFKLYPPTRDINVAASVAVMTMIVVSVGAIRYKGVGGWLKGFAKPLPVMLPFNLLELAIKPMSLALRLFGNILGAFVVMELIYMVLPPIIPAALSIYFDLFDGILQAYVFSFLTSIYIGEAVE